MLHGLHGVMSFLFLLIYLGDLTITFHRVFKRIPFCTISTFILSGFDKVLHTQGLLIFVIDMQMS